MAFLVSVAFFLGMTSLEEESAWHKAMAVICSAIEVELLTMKLEQMCTILTSLWNCDFRVNKLRAWKFENMIQKTQ